MLCRTWSRNAAPPRFTSSPATGTGGSTFNQISELSLKKKLDRGNARDVPSTTNGNTGTCSRIAN